MLKHLIGLGLLVGAPLAVFGFAQAGQANPPPPGFYRVTKVDDGDTIEVEIDRKTERVRMIGVNTPETVDPKRPIQCYGPEASKFTKAFLSHQSVRLERDATRPNEDRDKYQRLLRYVFLADGTNVNEVLISGGFGQEYTYQNQRYEHQAEFKAAEAEAKEQGKGLWSAATCHGDIKQPPPR